MYRVTVFHTLDDLFDDLAAAPVKFARGAAVAVKKNVEGGTRKAKALARERGGPHGKNYYKRISGEMTGPMSGEYGPEGVPKSDFVGAGYRNSAPNLDLPNSADIIGPKFASDVRGVLDEVFW